jgi:uncharacterized membrane protein YsdA (DUF1294 family)
MPFLSNLIIIYFVVISLVAAVMTVADKIFAKKGMWRIPEATLMLVGLLGGALAMFITMRTVRHKTKHKKFMIGLPLMIALHAALACFYIIKFAI